MFKGVVPEIILALLLISILLPLFDFQPIKAGEVTHVYSSLSSSEHGAMEWNRTYGGSSDEWAYSVVQTSDGGYALAGYTTSPSSGYKDFLLVKTDYSGNQQWNKTYGDTWNHEVAYSLVQTEDGGYVLAGYWAAGICIWLVKTDSSGNMQWNRTYDNVGALDIAYSVVHTGDGGYAMAGCTGDSGSIRDFLLVKTDSSGIQQWNKTYGGAHCEIAYSLFETSDGGYAIAGFTISFAQSIGDFWLVKTDSSGNMQWNKTYNYGNTYEKAYSLVETSDGGYMLAGEITSSTYGAGPYDSWLVKTDSSGNMQWNKAYGAANTSEIVDSLVQTSDGGYVIAGSTNSSGAGGYDYWLIKTNANGNMQWNKTYGGSGEDFAYSLVQTSDGGYALAGTTWSFGAGGEDFWLVKIGPSASTYDVGVLGISFPKTFVGQGYSLLINITVMNNGSYNELFNITAYANTTMIGTKALTLASGNSSTTTFTWNTAGFALGNYTISAVADSVPGETDTEDNTLIDGNVIVTIPGDVDGDFDVDLYDAVKLCTRYGAKKGMQNYDPNVDIDGDGQIFIFDAVILGVRYGQKYP